MARLPQDKDRTKDLQTITFFVEEATSLHPKPVYVGIDPGSHGAIGMICGRVTAAVDIPVMRVKRSKSGRSKMKTVLDAAETHRLFSYLHPLRGRMLVVLEQAIVQRFGMGASPYNAFRVGVSYGAWTMYLIGKAHRIEEVHPTSWKNKFGLWGEDKEVARVMAREMFPGAAMDLKRKKDADRAEALLLAEYGRRLDTGRY